jgi:hypothetical protein
LFVILLLVLVLVWPTLVILVFKVNAAVAVPQHVQVTEIVLLASQRRLAALFAQILHAVRRIAVFRLLPLASKLAILFKNALMAEFELLPSLALTLDATKTFAVMRLAALLTWFPSAAIALSISPPQVTAAPTRLVQAITAYLMNAVYKHVPVMLTSDAPRVRFFAPILKEQPVPLQLAVLENAA